MTQNTASTVATLRCPLPFISVHTGSARLTPARSSQAELSRADCTNAGTGRLRCNVIRGARRCSSPLLWDWRVCFRSVRRRSARRRPIRRRPGGPRNGIQATNRRPANEIRGMLFGTLTTRPSMPDPIRSAERTSIGRLIRRPGSVSCRVVV